MKSESIGGVLSLEMKSVRKRGGRCVVASEVEQVPVTRMNECTVHGGRGGERKRTSGQSQLGILTQASLSPPLPPPNTTTFFRHPTSSRSLIPSLGPPSAPVPSVDAVRLPLVDDGSYEAITKACAFLAWDSGRPFAGRISGRAYSVTVESAVVSGTSRVSGLDMCIPARTASWLDSLSTPICSMGRFDRLCVLSNFNWGRTVPSSVEES
jgi:hypothetical protein